MESWIESQSRSRGVQGGPAGLLGQGLGLGWQEVWPSLERMTIMVFGPPAFSGVGGGQGQPRWVLGQAECYLSRCQYLRWRPRVAKGGESGVPGQPRWTC